MRPTVIICFAASLIASGCGDQTTAARPAPATLTDDAIGHYDQMIVVGHRGPKAQVHLAGATEPLWFTQVRDALAFERGEEKDAEITVIYVNDMGIAPTWDDPGPDNWIAADTAHFVVGSDKRGGMGAPELVPFAEESAAMAFAGRHGGRVTGFSDITNEMVLGPVDIEPDRSEATAMEGIRHPAAGDHK